MTLQQAISILSRFLNGPGDPDTYDFDEAVQLGIEALIQQHQREEE